MTSRPALRALRHVALLTSAYDESVEFYAGPWGLEVVAESDDGPSPATYLRASGPEHHVLELHRSETNGLHHVAFAAGSREEVDRAHAWVLAEGVGVLGAPALLEGPGGGYGFRLLDLENRLIEISAEVYAVPERTASAVPTKVAHVVLNTVDIDAATAWYTRVLGFRVSDWSEHQMVFLRTNSDHHVVAFNQAPHTAPNHTAYEVGDLDAFLHSIGRLKVAGHETAWGPGRHGPGDNAFAYYVDPAGLVPEVTAEVLQVDEETWLPRVWQRTPELADLFRTAGPPSSHIRGHMGGVPDPGWAAPITRWKTATREKDTMTETLSTPTSTPELESLIEGSLALDSTRNEDWDTLKFQTKAGEQFRRAQVRYIGSGATGHHEGDSRTLPSEHFTFSNMVLPSGCVGPEHTHPDVEEVFFVLEGQVEFSVHDVEDGTKRASRVLGYRDLIRVPAGVPRSLRTVSDEDARICVIIGAKKPQLPFYPVTSEMHGVTRD